jgi:hypothetical protein
LTRVLLSACPSIPAGAQVKALDQPYTHFGWQHVKAWKEKMRLYREMAIRRLKEDSLNYPLNLVSHPASILDCPDVFDGRV